MHARRQRRRRHLESSQSVRLRLGDHTPIDAQVQDSRWCGAAGDNRFARCIHT
jgi:hypothetical protein